MIVLDCSAALAISRFQPEGLRLRSFIERNERVIVPELFHVEVVHALLKYVRGGHFDPMKATSLLGEIMSLVDEFVPMADLDLEVMGESQRLGHPSYDLYYFVLARRRAATLLTLDRRLNRLCSRHGVDCVCEVAVGDETWSIRSHTEDGPGGSRGFTRAELEERARGKAQLDSGK